jgi:hypothetical protein
METIWNCRSVFDSSDSEFGDEWPDTPEVNLSHTGQDNVLPFVSPSSYHGLEMEGNKLRILFCSTYLPLDSMVVREAPASWGKFFRVEEGYIIRVPTDPGECSLELIHPLDDIGDQKTLFLYICSDRPKPCICVILIE